MKTRGKNLHRGAILEEAVKQNPVKVTQLVKQLNISRGTYYNHIANAKLPFEVLIQYGKVLKHDFSSDFPEMKKYNFEESEAPYGQPSTINEAIEQRDYWKDKYYKLMEQFHKMMMDKKEE